jgi:hypothetical protein
MDGCCPQGRVLDLSRGYTAMASKTEADRCSRLTVIGSCEVRARSSGQQSVTEPTLSRNATPAAWRTWRWRRASPNPKSLQPEHDQISVLQRGSEAIIIEAVNRMQMAPIHSFDSNTKRSMER